MSTKWIRTMAEGELRRLEGRAGGDVEQRRACARLALAEVEAIENAARDVDREGGFSALRANGYDDRHKSVTLLERIARDAP